MIGSDEDTMAAYAVAAPDDFGVLLEPGRYAARSSAFDRLIRASSAHDWNPLDSDDLDFSEPFDLGTPLLPEWLVGPLQTPYVSAALADPAKRTQFINRSVFHTFSNILHGEQGAFSLSVSLCQMFENPGAQEYAANQAREEARHVSAFSRYIQARWGEPAPCGPALKSLLSEIIAAPELAKKVVGMQVIIEGLAMGLFAELHQHIADPLARKMLRLVMTDESAHHKFGKSWAEKAISRLSPGERSDMEDWAAEQFEALFLNIAAPSEQAGLYAALDLDLDRAQADFEALYDEDARREDLQRPGNIFRVLIRTLLGAGVITSRTRPFYARYVDMEVLRVEEATLSA